jgi:molybdate transport system substrate-binding protein
MIRWPMVALLAAVPLGCSAPRDAQSEVWVFAAASLRDAVLELGDAFEAAAGAKLVYNFAGSNDLAQQIAATPKAHVFLSASEEWMDFVEERGLIKDSSRTPLLSNRLVVVAHLNFALESLDPAGFCEAEFKHLSLANPDAVPAGKYAKEWLESVQCAGQSLWDVVADRVAPAPDARAALAVVEAGPDTIGIVYKTDAATSERVKVVYEVPEAQGPQIRYAAALIGDDSPQPAEDFFAFLQSSEAKAVWERHGFVSLF